MNWTPYWGWLLPSVCTVLGALSFLISTTYFIHKSKKDPSNNLRYSTRFNYWGGGSAAFTIFAITLFFV